MMQTPVLREKDKSVLYASVELYLKMGTPVSSGSLVEKKVIPASPATVRNIMAKLEEAGYLVQPHTSSGRVPTDKGLRFFVNHLLNRSLLSNLRITPQLDDFVWIRGDFSSLLIQVSELLAEHSDNLGFVLSPHVSRIPFSHIRFLQAPDNKVMIILTTPSDLILTEIVPSSYALTQNELDRAAQDINSHFRGKNLVYIRDYLLRELPKYKLGYENAINKIINLLRSSISQEERESRIYLQGASHLLEKADLFDMDKLKLMFQKFEEKAKLAKLLSDFISLDRVKVLIGSETNIPDISDCSLVLSHYGPKNQILGTLGIIGPKRIPYEKIIPLVEYVAQKLSQALSQEHV
jgi:heat-inducible transcriptional repressor